MFRRIYLFAAVCILSFVLACGPITQKLRLGLIAARPALQVLVAQGKLTQAQVDSATRDITDLINAASRAETAIKAIPSTVDKNGQLLRKADAYLKLAEESRAVLARHNLAGGLVLDDIGALVQGIIDSLDEFNRAVRGESSGGTLTNIKAQPTSAGPGHSTRAAEPEKDLENSIKQQLEEFKKVVNAAKSNQ